VPVLFDVTEYDHDVAPDSRALSITVRAAQDGRGPLDFLRVIPDPTLSPWLDPIDEFPLQLPPGQSRRLTFRVREGLSAPAAGSADIHFVDGPISGVRTVVIRLWPVRRFAGVFAIDYGSSRLAAAYIDPASGQDVPTPVVLLDGERSIESAVQFDFTEIPPLTSPAPDLTDPAIKARSSSVFPRPRQSVLSGERRAIVRPGVGTDQVSEASAAGWALAYHLTRFERSGRPGRPDRLLLPVSASFTPTHLQRLREAIDAHPALAGRVSFQPDGRFVLDEATAVAFAWIRSHLDELSLEGERTFRLMVLDAGAASVDVSLLELAIKPVGAGRLRVTPRILAIDGFTFLSGDRVTAQVVRLLRARAAAGVNPDLQPSETGPLTTETDRRAESAVPIRFAGLYAAAHDQRFSNFHLLWAAADRVVRNGDRGGSVRIDKLFTPSGPTDLELRVSVEDLRGLLQTEVEAFIRRLRSFLTKDESGEHWPIDRLIITGGASHSAILQAAIEEFAASAQIGAVDRHEDGKAAVAAGAALAAYYHEYSAENVRAEGSARLILILEELSAAVPYSVLYNSGDVLQRLVAPGERFPPVDGGVGPVRSAALPYQRSVPFFRMAGGGPVPDTAGDRETLLQFLGLVELPQPTSDGTTFFVEVFPDHRLQVLYEGKAYLPSAAGSTASALDTPFQGRL
jgi:hypothetical protein